MKIAFVSTMNLRLYKYYGKRFLEEFGKFSSKDIQLFIVFEGDYPEEILKISENIIILPFLSTQHLNFRRKFSKLKEARGFRFNLIKHNKDEMVANVIYDFRFDAIRFSYKPFAIHQCLEYLPKDKTHLIWTDADLRCKKHFSPNDINEFLPHSDEVMTYLGRKDSYSECGFLGFNLEQAQTKKYINRLIEVYESGEIFSYDQWHDSFLWDQIRMEFEKNYNDKFKNISGDASDKEHVYKNTNLDNLFDHLKGPLRKDAGQSSDEDYKTIVSKALKVN